jgi:membrane protease YdiL (CAAX protease family)
MNAVSTLLLMVPFLLPILLANIAQKESSIRVFNWIYLALLNGLLALIGLGSLVIAAALVNDAFANGLQEQNPLLDVVQLRAARLDVAGIVLLAGCLLSIVVLLPGVRRAVARVLPIDPASAVHTTGLSLTATAFGLNIFQMMALSPLVFAAVNSDRISQQLQQGYLDVLVFPLLTFVIAALLGVGVYVRRNQDQALQRLGLTLPTVPHLALVIGTTVSLLIAAIATERIWEMVDPTSLKQVGGLSQALLGNMTGLAGALAIGASAAIGEEMFFRGAYQPRMGIPITALLFASFHVQYGITPATLLVLAIGVVLGVLRQRTSLTVCILVHFLYNFVSVLIS